MQTPTTLAAESLHRHVSNAGSVKYHPQVRRQLLLVLRLLGTAVRARHASHRPESLLFGAPSLAIQASQMVITATMRVQHHQVNAQLGGNRSDRAT